MADASNASLQTRQDSMGEQPTEDADTGARRGSLTGMLSEKATTELGGGRITVAIDEPNDRPITLAETCSNALEFLPTGAGSRHISLHA